jgi:hypothetical protein
MEGGYLWHFATVSSGVATIFLALIVVNLAKMIVKIAGITIASSGVGGVPAFISIHSEFWFIYIPVTLLAMVIPAILTVVNLAKMIVKIAGITIASSVTGI